MRNKGRSEKVNHSEIAWKANPILLLMRKSNWCRWMGSKLKVRKMIDKGDKNGFFRRDKDCINQNQLLVTYIRLEKLKGLFFEIKKQKKILCDSNIDFQICV